ncbi:hypothetical protein AB0P21_40225 [Kribbella sp. NPDC056861]|uniref:hypothetical protein n=1 Tax=Kribbella sp. NPDC056861 TaxID=3154857 RepID=UPI0034217501
MSFKRMLAVAAAGVVLSTGLIGSTAVAQAGPSDPGVSNPKPTFKIKQVFTGPNGGVNWGNCQRRGEDLKNTHQVSECFCSANSNYSTVWLWTR